MKANIQLILSAATALLAFALVSCSSGSSNSPAATTPGLGASCGSNMLQSQWGCLPSCGTNAVMYNGTCQQINGAYGGYGTNGYYPYGTSTYGYGTGYGGVGGNAAVCQGGCQAGQVMVQTSTGGMSCLPQGQCYPCYGTPDGVNCYLGVNHVAYYGY